MSHFILFYFLYFSPIAINQNNYTNITEILTIAEFNAINQFILQNGDKKTYCNRYNNNPHLEMDEFDLYLNPESSNNVFCDTEISGFNEIVIYNVGEEIQYFHILLVKNLEKNDDFFDFEEGLIENQVYLRNIYNQNADEMLKQLSAVYLPRIKQRCLK